MKYKKEFLIGGAVLVAIILIGAFVYSIKNKRVEAPAITPTISADVLKDEAPKRAWSRKNPEIASATNVTKVLAVDVTYSEAIAKYSDGHLIQFDQNCQAHPRSMVLLNGTTLMLDNRSSNDEIITVGEQKIALPGYGFKVITLYAPTIPTTYNMSCAESRNVNTITIQ